MKGNLESLCECARISPVVKAWMQHYKNGRVDFETMLVQCIVILSKLNENLTQELISQETKRPMIIKLQDSNTLDLINKGFSEVSEEDEKT